MPLLRGAAMIGVGSVPGPRHASGQETGPRFSGSTVTWAEAIYALEANARLEPAGSRYDIGPAGQRIQDAYEVCDEQVAGSVPGFHSVSGQLRRTILGEPDVWYGPRVGKTVWFSALLSH